MADFTKRQENKIYGKMNIDEELKKGSEFQAEAVRTMLKGETDDGLVEATANLVKEVYLAGVRLFRKKLWHPASEQPEREDWILMADEYGHYMAGQWQNDGKGFEGVSEIHVGGLSFELPLGLEGRIDKWCYIEDLLLCGRLYERSEET